jgi:hypothetical protein
MPNDWQPTILQGGTDFLFALPKASLNVVRGEIEGMSH